jgi:hypothetical protein
VTPQAASADKSVRGPLSFAEGGEHLVSMLRHIYLIKNFGDPAILVDKEGLAVRAHVLFPVQRLFTPDAVCLNDLFVGIGYEIELKAVL